MKFLLSLVMLFVWASAEKLQTTKTSCIQQSNYPNKTLIEQKKILVEKAKQESLEELYGTLIFSSTDIKNGSITSNEIKSRAVGAVRVKGNPSFYNGKNFGEICADVNVYITKKDLQKYTPKKVSLKHFCYNNSSVAMKDIKQQAKYSAYKEIISHYKPSLKLSGKEAEQYIHGFVTSNENFDLDTASYCFDAVGTILPYELEMNGHKTLKNSKQHKAKKLKIYKSCNDIKQAIPTAKSGVYTIALDDEKLNVYCDMRSKTGWTRIFHHDIGFGVFANQAEAYQTHINNPKAGKYSILSKLESFRKNGTFTFKISWPEFRETNIWEQTSNPTYQKVFGYRPIKIDVIDYKWGGLEKGDSKAFIDGSVNSGWWWYSIGLYEPYQNGIPAFRTPARVVNLYVK